MRRFAWIILAFPVIELIGLVLLAGRIGGLATLLWLVASALVGMWILRNQRLGLLLTAWGALAAFALAARRLQQGADPVRLGAAGLLVGVGVRMGNGCTSGHGVCGLSRFSLRSLVNVMAFMGAGFATVFVLRHLL